MKLKIEIVMDNEAFESELARGIECARILKALAEDLDAGNCLSDVGDHETLMDLNGNRVGEAKVSR
jgi:hypothetical protein